MKLIACLIMIGAVLFFFDCNFSAGIKKDFRTGLSFNYNGFHVQDVFLTDSASFTKRSGNEFTMGSRADILVVGISGYTLKEGRVLPGMAVDLTDKQGNKLFASPDVLNLKEGVAVQSASVLRSFVEIAPPMKSGETYHLKVHVWDKYNSANTLYAEASIVVK